MVIIIITIMQCSDTQTKSVREIASTIAKCDTTSPPYRFTEDTLHTPQCSLVPQATPSFSMLHTEKLGVAWGTMYVSYPVRSSLICWKVLFQLDQGCDSTVIFSRF